MMNPVEIIIDKRDGKKLTGEQIKFMIENYTAGRIPEYQMSAFLMAVCCRSMDTEETALLTQAMLDSGSKVIFDPHDFRYADKHSTGGIGDKVSIVLAPLMAACGLKIPMLSGRGLGHTGGTLDKLESIPGYRTNLSIDEFKSGVESVGCIISGQTPEIAPADKKIYALRDVSGTVESIPLICGSILSKKLAAGPNVIVFDIKCGNGAFMQTMDQAIELGENLCRICDKMGKKSAFLITDMNQPLGRAAGNSLEIDECLQCLKDNGPDDLMNVVFALGKAMLSLAGVATGAKATEMMKTAIGSGAALKKFMNMIEYQGGSTEFIRSRSPVGRATKIIHVKADKSGYIARMDTRQIGMLIIDMGGGRRKIDDTIDRSVGIYFHKKIGDKVSRNDTIAELHLSDKFPEEQAINRFRSLISISPSAVKSPSLILCDYE